MSQSLADQALSGLKSGNKDYRILYRYQRISNYSLDALRNGYLYFSHFPQLNDPFDPFITLIGAQLDDDLVNAFVERTPRILCTTPDCSSPTMWGHYANSCSGMCVGYAVYTGNMRLFNPVRYIEEVPTETNLHELMLLKHALWQHENEWRATWAGGEPQVYDLAHPVEVYLGQRCSDADRQAVEESLPKTVEKFCWKLPTFQGMSFAYVDYDVADVVKEFGRLPTLEEVIKPRKA